MKIIAISDTHNWHKKLIIPECDILIHAGDWTGMGYESEVRDFAKWLNKQTQCKNIIVIPGNHELRFEEGLPASAQWFKEEAPNVHLLINESVIIEGIKIYGSPITPFFNDWAWNKFKGDQIQPYWDAIPNDTNILITHGPPYDILDKTYDFKGNVREERLGCFQLMKRIQEVKPDLHFFGHIHAQGGKQFHQDGTSFYNAAICDEQYAPTNPLTEVEYVLEKV